MTIEQILIDAKKQSNNIRKDFAYNFYKKQIERISESFEEYENNIKKLCEGLKY